ncbi:MAG: sulfatase-like hydrolase/transferase [Verrucomicrobiales bacterium]
MNIRFASLFLLALLNPAIASDGVASDGVASDRPNIVWIVSEDNSKHYLELFDESGAETPNIAALAEHGLTFTRAFSNSPVCSVARTTLATGCYAPRIGTQFHRRSKPAELPGDLKLFPAYLRKAGYYTTNNSKKDYNAVETPGTWDESSNKATWRDRPDQEQPFFHMQSHTQSHESSLHFDEESYQNDKTVHDPDKVELPPYFPYTDIFRYTYARYLDNIVKIDDIVGETVAKLEEDGLLEDTVIFYFGDHGGVLPRSKGYLQESGLHVPLVVRIPENFSDLADGNHGEENAGFVNFVDFAPTVLKLAGLEVPEEMDGHAFLGDGVSLDEVAKRDSALGYADRFDEKYEMVRSLRVGDWKYIRSYQPYYPDGLQNNYRYKMLAYREWRDLYDRGELGREQRAFFEPKPAERLYDLSTDPHEVANLAKEDDQQARLVEMRETLQAKLADLPDLGFFPENILHDEAMEDPVAFGQENKARIARLMQTADLMLHPFADIHGQLERSLQDEDELVRYWAATVCATFGQAASELTANAKPLLKDDSPVVRVRAAEFLGLVGETDPRSTLIDVVNNTDHPVEQMIALNAAALFHENPGLAYPFEADSFTSVQSGGNPHRRILYFQNEWLEEASEKKKGKK